MLKQFYLGDWQVDPESRQPAAHGKTLEALVSQTNEEVRKLNLELEEQK